MQSRTLIVSIVLLLSALTGKGVTQTRQQPTTHQAAAQHMMPMAWVAPLFVEDQNFTSTLVLVNSTTVQSVANVTLRNLQGSLITQQSIAVAAKSDQRIAIEALLHAANSADTTGSITVSPSVGNVAAQLSVTYVAQPMASYIDEELGMPMADSSPVLRGVAENAHGSPILAVTSTASALEHITIACIPAHGTRLSKTLDLPANATILTQACNADRVPAQNIETIMAASADDAGGAFGIEVASDGPAGGFSAFGLVNHLAGQQGYVSALSFTDPMMLHSATTVFVGVPVGSSALLPVGIYKPTLALANFGTRGSRVTVSLAATTTDSPQSIPVANVSVPAGQAVMVDLPVSTASPILENSYVVTADTAPGTVVGKLVAIGDGALHEVELLGKDAQDPMNAGHHPWSLQDGADATLFLFNHTNIAQDVAVSLDYSRGKWNKVYHLRPQVTLGIGIRELIEQQIKDDEGKLLPATLTDGAIVWSGSRASISGRLLQSNATTAIARSFSCGIFDYIGDQLGALPATIIGKSTIDVSTSASLRATGEQLESNVSFCDPDGADTGVYRGTVSYFWQNDGPYSNLNPSSSTSSSYSPQGTSGGADTVEVTITDLNDCTAYGETTVTVQTPTYFFSPSATQISQPSVCTQEGYTGYFLDVSYYVADANSGRINQSGMAPGENLGDGVWHDSFATPTTTASDGSFDDTPRGDCYQTSGHFCATGPSQSFRLTNVDSTVFSIATNTTSRTCTDGIQLVIQGNPTAQNKTYTFGNIQ